MVTGKGLGKGNW